MFINEWFFPAALVSARVQPLRHAFGATIAGRRGPIAAIGGFAAVADYLADDYMLGNLISQQGLRVVLSPYLVETVIGERDLSSLFFRELRWTRTFRTLRPMAYFLSGITHGIPLSVLLLLSSSDLALALPLVAIHLALRWGGGGIVYATLGLPIPRRRLGLVPLRDGVSLLMWILSFLGQSVRWNDRRLRVDARGRLHPVAEAPSRLAPHPSSPPRA